MTVKENTPPEKEKEVGPSEKEKEVGPSEKEKEVGPSRKEPEVWRWPVQQNVEAAAIWKTCSHNGPAFAPPYERVPNEVKFKYS
ncbi:hypothetical protein CDAR_542321, partial [Caerostris darwini]